MYCAACRGDIHLRVPAILVAISFVLVVLHKLTLKAQHSKQSSSNSNSSRGILTQQSPMGTSNAFARTSGDIPEVHNIATCKCHDSLHHN